jgi:hypothetical protein
MNLRGRSLALGLLLGVCLAAAAGPNTRSFSASTTAIAKTLPAKFTPSPSATTKMCAR